MTNKIPEIRFPGFYGEWKENKINKFSKKNKLKNKDNLIDNVESVSNKYGFIRQENQFDNRVASDDLSNYYIIEKGMFAYNPSRINVGSIAYKDNNIVSVVSPLYVSFLLNKNLSDYFFYYWLETSNFIKFRDNYSEGSVRTTLSYESFSNIPIILPTLPEQEKIGSLFEKIDSLIEGQAGLVDSYKGLKKSLLQKMFPLEGEKIPQLRFPGFDGEWEEFKIKDIADVKAGGDINKSKLRDTGRYPVIGNGITKDSSIIGYYEDEYKVKAPAVTLTGRGDIGVPIARNVSFTPVVRLLSLKFQDQYNVYFMANSLSNVNFLKETTGVPQLTSISVKNYKIKITSPPEQKKIGDLFKKLDGLIEDEEKYLEDLKVLKKSLLQKMFV